MQTVLHHGSRSSISKRNGLDYVSDQTLLLPNFSPNIINQLSAQFCCQSLGLEQQWFSHYSLQARARSVVQFIPSKRDENGEDLPSHWRTPSFTFRSLESQLYSQIAICCTVFYCWFSPRKFCSTAPHSAQGGTLQRNGERLLPEYRQEQVLLAISMSRTGDFVSRKCNSLIGQLQLCKESSGFKCLDLFLSQTPQIF